MVAKRKTGNKSEKNEHSVPASILGIEYQLTYALYLILTAEEEDAGIYIEKLDDIHIETGSFQLIQTKYHSSEEGSLSDKSEDLWKTIRVWSENVQKERVSLNDNLIFTLITTTKAHKSSIAALLRDDNERDPKEAQNRLIKAADSSTNKELQDAFNSFKKLTKNQQLDLVKRIYIVDGSPDHSKVIDKIKGTFTQTRSEHRGKIFDSLKGWWAQKVSTHLEKQSSEAIKKSEVVRFLSEIRDQYVPDSLPMTYRNRNCEIDVQNDERRFVVHLKKITDKSTVLKKAILYFYRASEERAEWLRIDGLLKMEDGENELEYYDKKLVDKWEECVENIRRSRASWFENLFFGNKEVGWEIFSETRKQNIPIRHKVDEPYIMQGSYHILANEDKVAWYPDEVDKILNS